MYFGIRIRHIQFISIELSQKMTWLINYFGARYRQLQELPNDMSVVGDGVGTMVYMHGIWTKGKKKVYMLSELILLVEKNLGFDPELFKTF